MFRAAAAAAAPPRPLAIALSPSSPSNASSGNIVYVTANSTMYQYNGSNWLAVGGSSNSWNTTGNSGGFIVN